MNNFLFGLLALISALGSLSFFNYWFFGIKEKRLENKIDLLNDQVARISSQLSQQIFNIDAIREFILDKYLDKEDKNG
jgi:hypothetical protein